MARYRTIDDHVVPESLFREKQADIHAFLTARTEGRTKFDFAFADGKTLNAVAPIGPATPPIGKGLPLSILIREVYTGKYPESNFLGIGDKDVAVVSAIKNYDVFSASSRALNFMMQNVNDHSRLRRPNVFTDGTSLVSYSPAIMTDSLTIGFEIATATFPQELVSALSTAFNTLAGIPLLLPYAGYLLGAGELFKLAGNIGHSLFDGVKFSVTEPIDFDIWGSAPVTCSP